MTLKATVGETKRNAAVDACMQLSFQPFPGFAAEMSTFRQEPSAKDIAEWKSKCHTLGKIAHEAEIRVRWN